MFALLIGWLYGALTLASIWALVMWITLLVVRPFADDFAGFRRDTYCWIALSNVIGCLGTFVLSVMRTMDIVVMGNDIPHFVDPVIGAIGIGLLLSSRTAMVYASSLHSKPWRWWWYLAILGLWTAFMLWWSLV